MRRLLLLALLLSGTAFGQAAVSSGPCKMNGSDCLPSTASALRSATTNVDVAAATAPSNGQVLTATSSTTATWQPLAAGSPVGSDTEVQFNDGGALAGATGLTYGKASKSVSGTGPWTLTPTSDITPLTVRAYSSGTSPIIQWQTSANGALGNISHDGVLFAPIALTVLPVTATAAPTAAESAKVFTNEGDADGATVTLPAAAAGLTFTLYVQAAQTLTVTAGTGDTIRIAGNVTAAAGSITSSTVGSAVVLVAINATEWVATSAVGSWSF